MNNQYSTTYKTFGTIMIIAASRLVPFLAVSPHTASAQKAKD